MDILVYKKGLDDREIFSDAGDYELWERLLAEYLQPYKVDEHSVYKTLRPYRIAHKKAMNLCGQVELLAYCLMPTYLYMVVREKTAGAVTALMRRVTTYYSMVYNRKRKRSGFVFEGAYKSKKLVSEEDTKEAIVLVHSLPGIRTVKRFGMVETSVGGSPAEYPYSSIRDYLSKKPRDWITAVGGGDMYPMDKAGGKLPW